MMPFILTIGEHRCVARWASVLVLLAPLTVACSSAPAPAPRVLVPAAPAPTLQADPPMRWDFCATGQRGEPWPPVPSAPLASEPPAAAPMRPLPVLMPTDPLVPTTRPAPTVGTEPGSSERETMP
jgi:hypothetical protein